MANDTANFGFIPWGPLLITREVLVRGNDNDPVFVGDMCAQATDGYVTGSIAGGGTNIVGPALSFLTGGITNTVRIAFDPHQLMTVRSSGVTHTIAEIGLMWDHLYAFGNFNTKRSGTKLTGQGAAGSVNTGGFKVWGAHNNLNSDGTANDIGSTPVLVVSHNEHMMTTKTGF